MDNKRFIKVSKDTLINEQAIVWIKKLNDCLIVSMVHSDGIDPTGFQQSGSKNVYKICKSTNLHDYNRLNKHFDE